MKRATDFITISFIVFFLNFFIYFFSYIYLLTSILNFLYPITKPFSILITAVSITLSYFNAKYFPLKTFSVGRNIKIPKTLIGVTFLFSLVWIYLVMFIPSTGIDTNVYHLPLSLLINHSIWYPGIGKLSSHFGFPNGTSVLASVLTSFNIVGFETIPSLIIWILLGIGTFTYLIRRGIHIFVSMITAGVFLFTPSIFFGSYNMGTDLPCACFLTFGLLALSDKHFEDACLFLSLSAVFKTLGMLASLLVIPYVLLICMISEKPFALNISIVLSILLLIVLSARVYIATGNPIYPALPLNLASWGISLDLQSDLINKIKNYSRVEMTLTGFIAFIKNFLLFPRTIKSSFWFWPFLFVCLVASFFPLTQKKYYGENLKLYKGENLNFIYLTFIIIILLSSWFSFSPLFRYISGVFIFITIKSFIFSYNKSSTLNRSIICITSVSMFLIFLYNTVNNHLFESIFPLINSSPERVETFMPWNKRHGDFHFFVEKTEDGFIYSKSTSTFCQRMPPPCINSNSLDDEKELIKEFRKYNKL